MTKEFIWIRIHFQYHKYALHCNRKHCKTVLAYPHAWMRLTSAKILGTFLSNINHEDLNEPNPDKGFLYDDTENDLRSLILYLCAQYTPNVGMEMAEQVTAVLFQIFKLVQDIPRFQISKSHSEDAEIDTNAKLNIRWILFKLRKAINAEVAKAPTCMNIRTTIFTVWLHIISSLQSKKVKLEMLDGKRPRPEKRKAVDFDIEDELLKED